MKQSTAIKIITNELRDLDVPKDSQAYTDVYNDAIAGSDIMTKAELIDYIERSLEVLPNWMFQ